MNLEDLKKSIENMNKHKHIEILKILRKYNVQYTENRNGIFFNLSDLLPNVIEELIQFTIYLDKQEEIINSVETKKNELQQLLI